MNCLNESNIFGEFLNGLSASKSKKGTKNNAPYLGGSISKYTKNLIMTFPMLCDDSLPPSTASMISRAHERHLITLFELLFASAQFNAKDGMEVLKSIHKNIEDMDLDDYIDTMNNFSAKATGVANTAFGKIAFGESSAEINTAIREMVETLKLSQKSYLVNSFNERSLNEYAVLNINGNMVVKEFGIDDDISQMDDNNIEGFTKKQKAQMNRDQIRHDENEEIRQAASFPLKYRNMQNQSTDFEYNMLSKQLMDSDVKKANELQPTLMIVRFNELVPTADGEGVLPGAQKSFIAGVKSRLIPTDSMDIVERLVAKNRTKLSFLNLIRATTGEIKLKRDFLLCVDQAKIDAKNSAKKGTTAQIWKTLEKLSVKNNWNKLYKKGNDATAITSLVINQETVNMMKKEYNFDIESPKNAKMIMDIYNFLAIIIADESIEVCKFLYNGNSQFEEQSYSYLERESNDNSYKKVINLIGKMNGGR